MNIINAPAEKLLAKYFDHTFLKAYVTRAGFEELYKEARELGAVMIAVNPTQVRVCKELLRGCDVYVGAVISFPLGQTVLEVKVEETKKAIQGGFDEIDYVINIGGARMRRWDYIEEEMRRVTEVCRAHRAINRVIFENYYLGKGETKKLAEVAKKVEPNYTRISTGFGAGGAMLEDVRLAKEAAGDDVEVKVTGGVRNWEACKAMVEAGAKRIGTNSFIVILEGFRNKRGQQK